MICAFVNTKHCFDCGGLAIVCVPLQVEGRGNAGKREGRGSPLPISVIYDRGQIIAQMGNDLLSSICGRKLSGKNPTICNSKSNT